MARLLAEMNVTEPLVVAVCQRRIPSRRLKCNIPGAEYDHIVDLQTLTSIYCHMSGDIALKWALRDMSEIADDFNQNWNLHSIPSGLNQRKAHYIRQKALPAFFAKSPIPRADREVAEIIRQSVPLVQCTMQLDNILMTDAQVFIDLLDSFLDHLVAANEL